MTQRLPGKDTLEIPLEKPKQQTTLLRLFRTGSVEGNGVYFKQNSFRMSRKGSLSGIGTEGGSVNIFTRG